MSRQELPLQGQMEVQWHVKGAVLSAWLAAEKTRSSGRTGTEQPMGILKSLQHSLQGLGGVEGQRRLQKAKTSGHQLTYGDVLMIEFLCDQAFTVLGMASR